MIKWKNIFLTIAIIILLYKIINFGSYQNKIDVLIHYILINITFILIYDFIKIIKKEDHRTTSKSLGSSKHNAN